MSLETVLRKLAVTPVTRCAAAMVTEKYESKQEGNPRNPGNPRLHQQERRERDLDAAITAACAELDIAPNDVRAALSAEDVADWEAGYLPPQALAAFAAALECRRAMRAGARPDHYTAVTICRHCGPVWVWPDAPAEIEGCPWCTNRLEGRPIPRPAPVQCLDCRHFERIDHPNLGHCTAGQPEALAGLWDSDQRGCLSWLPSIVRPPRSRQADRSAEGKARAAVPAGATPGLLVEEYARVRRIRNPITCRTAASG